MDSSGGSQRGTRKTNRSSKLDVLGLYLDKIGAWRVWSDSSQLLVFSSLRE